MLRLIRHTLRFPLLSGLSLLMAVACTALVMAPALKTSNYIDILRSLAPELAAQRWGAARAYYSFGSNSRVRGARARRELHWSPTGPSLLDWIAQDLPVDTKSGAPDGTGAETPAKTRARPTTSPNPPT